MKNYHRIYTLVIILTIFFAGSPAFAEEYSTQNADLGFSAFMQSITQLKKNSPTLAARQERLEEPVRLFARNESTDVTIVNPSYTYDDSSMPDNTRVTSRNTTQPRYYTTASVNQSSLYLGTPYIVLVLLIIILFILIFKTIYQPSYTRVYRGEYVRAKNEHKARMYSR